VVLEETPVQGNNDVANLSAVTENLGTIVYRTGEVEIDYSIMPGYRYEMTENSASDKNFEWTYTFYPPQTNTYIRSNLAQSYVKIKWQSKRLVDESKWQFALSRATTGHVREGLNTFVAFVDLDGNGVWSENEPMGVTRNVNVGWSGTDVEIEITNAGVRFDLGFEANSVARETSVKVKRLKVNEKTENAYGKIANPLFLDFNIGDRTMLHDGDFMKGAELDIDWNTFAKDVLSSKMVVDSKMNITVTYKLVGMLCLINSINRII
jgi:hypothetical protein